MYASEYNAINLKKETWDFVKTQRIVKCNAEFLKFLLFGLLAGSSNIFLRALQRWLCTHPPTVAALFGNFCERKPLSGALISAYVPRMFFWSKTSSKHKNAPCFKLKSKPIKHRYFTTSWSSPRLQRRSQHGDWVSVPRCGVSRCRILRAIHFPDSDGDLTVLQQN